MKEHIEAERVLGLGNHFYYNYIIKRQQYEEAVFDDSTYDCDVPKRQEKVCHMHNMRLINWFPERPSVLNSMCHHFEPDYLVIMISKSVDSYFLCKKILLVWPFPKRERDWVQNK
jgi:hypothetical protein